MKNLLEKEIKILDIEIDSVKDKLQKLGAKLQYDTIQKIYVFDLQSINSRFNDCLEQAKTIANTYEYEVIRSKLKGIFLEIDDLTSEKQEKEISNLIGYKNLGTFLSMTPNNNELMKKLNTMEIKKIIGSFGINPNKWIRLRETNNKSTITIKHILNKQNSQQIELQKVIETEMDISSIEQGKKILQQLGLIYRNYQEKRRIQYNLDGVEIDIDCWPLIPPYIEIEGNTEEIINSTLKKLDFKNKKIVSCNTTEVYKNYGIDIYKYRELRLEK